jgi:hypothetical protein
VLIALAVTMMAASLQVRRALVAGGASRPELNAAPTGAAGWLAENPPAGRMFNYQPWGSYLEFRLRPEVKPAVDSRIEFLPAERWRDYLAIAAGRWDAERLLDEWGVGCVVTDGRRTPARPRSSRRRAGGGSRSRTATSGCSFARAGRRLLVLQRAELPLQVAQQHHGP